MVDHVDMVFDELLALGHWLRRELHRLRYRSDQILLRCRFSLIDQNRFVNELPRLDLRFHCW